MSPHATLRLLALMFPDTGAQAGEELDTEALSALALSGYSQATCQRIALAPGAADQAVTFTDAIAIVLYSEGEPFDLRVAAGETLLENLRAFVVWGDDEDDGVHQTSVLLSGRGVATSYIRAWVIEKP